MDSKLRCVFEMPLENEKTVSPPLCSSVFVSVLSSFTTSAPVANKKRFSIVMTILNYFMMQCEAPIGRRCNPMLHNHVSCVQSPFEPVGYMLALTVDQLFLKKETKTSFSMFCFSCVK